MRKTPNPVERSGLYPHFDTRSLWAFILDSLGALNRQKPIDAICVTTHGATAALLDADGGLALPILDYEHDGPDTLAADYDAVRPPFAESRNAAPADRPQPRRPAVLAERGRFPTTLRGWPRS